MSDHAPDSQLRYTYTGLASERSIRLIYFPRSTISDGRLSCTLKEVSLDSSPTFQALSYTWGDGDSPCHLICEGQTIAVTQNLYNALAQLRTSSEELCIWIDAVCINQANVDEKSQQIPLMAEIYDRASNVLIWLGLESQGSVESMQYLARIGKSFLDRGGPVREPKEEQNGEWGADNKVLWETVYGDPDIMQQTDTIWKRSWFSRRWIIQELAFAKTATVHCGGEQLEWDILAKAAEILAVLEGDGSEFINRRSGKPGGSVCKWLHNATKLERIRKEVQISDRNKTERKLLDCLNDARDFNCTHEKDRIFALLGIINHRRDNPFTINYATPTAEVFQAFARYCLEHEKVVDILAYAGRSNHQLCGESLQLPSWVPDWRLPLASSSDKLQGSDTTIHLDQDFTESSCFRLDESAAELTINCAFIDRIAAVCPSIGTIEEIAMEAGAEKWTVVNPSYITVWYQALEELLRKVFELMKIDISTAEYAAGGESVWEALGRTLVLDSNEVSFDMKTHPDSLISKEAVPEGFPQPKLTDEFFLFRKIMFTSFGEFQSAVVVRDSEGHTVDASSQPEDPVPQLTDTSNYIIGEFVIDYEYMQYLTRLVARCQDRSFLVTRAGYIGLGPKEMQHDDLLVIVEGSNTPCVLRVREPDALQSQDDHVALNPDQIDMVKFQLIGKCYTHGFMHGDIWDDDDLVISELTLV